jgi:hypothetical protein
MLHGTPFSVESSNKHFGLAKNAPAMQLMPDGSGKLRMGTLIRLPEGAEVELCGEGFNDRTAKVQWQGATYYVFLDDLQSSSAPWLTAACG